MKAATGRVLRWLTGRVTMRPRRITTVFWLLYLWFLPQISHLADRYRTPIRQADNWLMLALIPVGLILFAYIWYGGRRARRRRRGRKAQRSG